MKKYTFDILGLILAAAVFYGVYEKPQYSLYVSYTVYKEEKEKKPTYSFVKFEQLDYLYKNNLFSSDKSYETAKKGQGGFKDLPDLKTLLGLEPNQDLKLVGIFYSGDSKIAVLRSSNGKSITLKEGQILEDGSVVKYIDKNSIVLEYKEKKEVKVRELKLFNIQPKGG